MSDAFGRARALREEGVALNSAGRPQEALDALGRALDLLDDEALAADDAERTRLRVRTLLTRANAEFEQSGPAAALATVAEAEHWARELGDRALFLHVHLNRGILYGRSGSVTAAVTDLDAVMPHLDLFTVEEQTSALLNRGALWALAPDPRRARETFARCAALAEEHGLLHIAFMARHNEGYAAYLVGDFPAALRIMAGADLIDTDVSRGSGLLDRARVLLDAGLLTEADDMLRRAEEVCLERGQGHLVGEVQLEWTRCRLLQGDPAGAERLAVAARERFTERGAPALADRARMYLLQVALAHGDPADDIAAAAARIIASSDERGDLDLATATRTLAAEALLRAGAPGAASTLLAELPRAEATSLPTRLQAAYVEASIAAARQDVATGRRVLRRAARDLSRGQETSASLDLRAARGLHGVRLAQLELDLALPQGVMPVLVALERWRTATEHLPVVRPPHDADQAALFEQLRARRAWIRESPDHPELARWQREAATLERRIRERDWSTTHRDGAPFEPTHRPGLGRGVTRAVVEAHRAALTDAGRDVLTTFSRDGDLWGVAIVNGRARIRRLAELDTIAELGMRIRADLAVAMHQRLGALRSAVLASLRQSLDTLDDLVVRPWGLGERGVVVVPSRRVFSVPWGLMTSLREVPVTVTPSLASYVNRLQAPARSAVGSVHVAVGPDLQRADEELAVVTRSWRDAGAGTTSSRERGGLIDALTRADVVHVAAHGHHEQDSPLFSTLLLSDGHVFAHELQPSGIATRHVVLSACDVGTATVRPGEEALGMASTMLALGASCVVAAVAPVPHDLAVDTMLRYHRHLAAGRASDEALALAVAETDPLAGVFVSAGATWWARRP